jgi:hypothetical protein
MKSFIKIGTFAFAILMVLASCKDKNPPIITIISPIEDAYYQAGANFHYEANIEDDRSIATIRMYIGDVNGVPANDFVLTSTEDLVSTEKKKNFQGHSDIPTNANGEYYIHFEASDREGKSAQVKRRFFVQP